MQEDRAPHTHALNPLLGIRAPFLCLPTPEAASGLAVGKGVRAPVPLATLPYGSGEQWDGYQQGGIRYVGCPCHTLILQHPILLPLIQAWKEIGLFILNSQF